MFNKKGYLLVSWKKLLPELHKHCLTPGCLSATIPEETIIKEQGAAVSVTMFCMGNHENTWESSEFYPKKGDYGKARSKLNVVLSCFILLTGLLFSPVQVQRF